LEVHSHASWSWCAADFIAGGSVCELVVAVAPPSSSSPSSSLLPNWEPQVSYWVSSSYRSSPSSPSTPPSICLPLFLPFLPRFLRKCRKHMKHLSALFARRFHGSRRGGRRGSGDVTTTLSSAVHDSQRRVAIIAIMPSSWSTST